MNNGRQELISDMPRAMEFVYLYKALHDRDLLHLFDEYPGPKYVGEEYEEELGFALYNLSEAVWSRCSQYDDAEVMYFSHPAMMEYYRLCREYGKLTGAKLRDNPYMHRAAESVRDKLEQNGCYSCEYRLQTKLHHKWASGIVFRMWPEFNGLIALLVKMSQVFSFYEREVVKLKTEIQTAKRKLPQKTVLEEAA